MTERHAEKEDREHKSNLLSSLLSPVMFYLAGRLDSADRRATLVAGSAIAFLGFIESRPDISLVPLDGFGFILLPMLLTLFSAGTAVWALFPRNLKSEDWVSSIFSGESTPEIVLKKMKSSDDAAISGLIASQALISSIVRRKNKLSWWAGAMLVAAFVLYVSGRAFCWT